MLNPMMSANLPPPSEKRGPVFLQAVWIGVAIATLSLIARCMARYKRKARLLLDDWLMILALACGVIGAILATASVNSGFGSHIFYLDHHDISQAIKYQYFSQPFVYAALVAGRVSFAVSLLQVIGQNQIVRSVLHGLILGQVLINAIFAGLQMGQCSPPAKYWNRVLPGTCMNYHVIEYGGYVQGVFNIITDLALALLPAYVISNLHMAKKKRVFLVFLMGLGIFNMIAAIVTLAEITKIGGTFDITYDYILVDIWGVIQTYLAIVLASAPFIHPLFHNKNILSIKFFRSLFVRSSKRTSGQSRRLGQDNCLERVAPRLPTIHNHRFVTTTLRNAGMDDDYDSSNKSVAEIGLERWTAQSEIDYMNHHGIDAVRYA